MTMNIIDTEKRKRRDEEEAKKVAANQIPRTLRDRDFGFRGDSRPPTSHGMYGPNVVIDGYHKKSHTLTFSPYVITVLLSLKYVRSLERKKSNIFLP
jgi:hypothetical protein